MPNTEMLHLKQFIPYQLSTVSNRISKELAKKYLHLSIKPMEWRVLAVIGSNRSMFASNIVEATQMDKVAVSRALAKLEHMGKVSKQAFFTDKRRSVITLTEQGHLLYEKIVPLANHFQQNLLSQLSTDEKNQLKHLVAKLNSLNYDVI